MPDPDPMAAVNGAISFLRGQLHASLDHGASLAAKVAELEAAVAGLQAAAESDNDDG
jgi:hypothetical protein|tara:strand:+ start:148 stop:318 length:171 start_codon:yes stop_codon:yes gene_type:complete